MVNAKVFNKNDPENYNQFVPMHKPNWLCVCVCIAREKGEYRVEVGFGVELEHVPEDAAVGGVEAGVASPPQGL